MEQIIINDGSANEKVNEAIIYAAFCHAGQTRKCNPFIAVEKYLLY